MRRDGLVGLTLVGVAIARETPDLIKNNVRLAIMGDLKRLPQATLDLLRGCMAVSSRGRTLNFTPKAMGTLNPAYTPSPGLPKVTPTNST